MGTKKQAAVRNPLTAMSWARGREDRRTLYAAAEAEAGEERREWRQSRVQMNAHLKLSLNPFTIDAVQSGRYLHMHMSIECVLAVLQPTTYNLEPTTPSACSSPFFWARAICLCLSWLRQHDYTHTLTGQGVRAIRVCFLFNPPWPAQAWPTACPWRETQQ